MYSARGGWVHGLSITLAWWQLLALCWMINNWLPVQWLLTGYFKDHPRDPPWTHEKIFRNRKSIVPPRCQLWLCSQSPEMHRSPGVPSQGDHWKPLMMGQRISQSHVLSLRWGRCLTGAQTLALLVRVWGSSHFCLPWLVFYLLACFPHKDKENLQGVLPVSKES